jgi:hypothetical protein
VDTVRLAFRDPDRSPVIYCVKEVASRHYDLNVEIIRVRETAAYEAAPFDGTCDLICEHHGYLYEEVAQRRHAVAMFLAPVIDSDDNLVVGPRITGPEDLRGARVAVRARGRPFAITLQLKSLGLDDGVNIIRVDDEEVGRWGQWKKVASGECAATFIPCLHLAPALEAGLHVLPGVGLQTVGHFVHACSSAYAQANQDVMLRYIRAAVHAICLMKLRRNEALDIVSGEPARLMRLEDDRPTLERAFDCIVAALQIKPYPTPASIANAYEVACAEWPGARGINPQTLWDLHWLKRLDDEGFIDRLIAELKG